MKKIIIQFILLFSFGYSYSQNLTTIDLITTSDENIKSISLFNLSQEKAFFNLPYQDSIRIELNTINDDIYNLWVQTKNKKYREQVFLGQGKIEVNIKINNNKITIEKVKGSDIYYDHQKYGKALPSLSSLSDSLNRLYHKELFLNHYESTFSLKIARNYIEKNQNNKSSIKWILDKMKTQIPSVKNHFLFESTFNRANSLVNIKGLKLDEFKVIDILGQKTTINKTEHDLTIIDFWFLQCPPCIRDHKVLIKQYEDLILKNSSIRLIGISNDQNLSLWTKYLLNKKIEWENYLINTNDINNIVNHLSISTFPTYLVLGKNQEILMSTNSLEEVLMFVNN